MLILQRLPITRMAEGGDQNDTADVSSDEETRKILPSNGVSAVNGLINIKCINYIKPASNENRYANNSRLQMDIGADTQIAADYTDALEDSTPVYPDVMPISLRDHDRLQRIGSGHGLLPIAIMSLPNNGIRLIGKNITRFEKEILEVFEESGHSRVEVRNSTKEMDGIMYIGPQHFSGEVRRMHLASDGRGTDKKVSCEVIAVADDKITGERVFFSVVPAHLILSTKQCKSMASVNSNLSHIRSILGQQMPDCKYEYKNENQRRCQKLLPQPLLSYGLWDVGNAKLSPESNKSEGFEQVFDSHPVMSDMALLKFDKYESDELASKSDVFDIPSKCHLDLLSKRQQRVIVGNFEGRLIYYPQCVGSGNERYGLHLAFTITTKDSNGKTCTLTKGDSGLAVFFKGKQDQLIPVGMLVGKFAEDIEDFDSEIYQAIVLSHAFKEIEHDYPDTIGNIRVLETCHRTADDRTGLLAEMEELAVLENHQEIEALKAMIAELERKLEEAEAKAFVTSSIPAALAVEEQLSAGSKLTSTSNMPSNIDTISDAKLNQLVLPEAGSNDRSSLSETAPDTEVIQVSTLEASNGDNVLSAADIDVEIIRLLDSAGVPYYQLMHVRGEARMIEIIGNEVSKLSAKLAKATTSTGYSLVIKDVEFEEPSTAANWIKLCMGPRDTGMFALEMADQHISVIDAIMQGKDGKRRRSQLQYFLLTTAHSLLTKEQNERIMASTQQLMSMHNEITLQAYEKDFYMSVKGHREIDIIGVPRLLHKCWIPNQMFNEWAVMQDIAFIELDNSQLHGLATTSNHGVAQVGHKDSANEQAYIVSIRSKEDLQKFDGSRICCAGKPGTLIRSPYICNAGCIFGSHLAFVLDGDADDCLQEGDCGSFLYLEERNDERVPILGMFTSQLKSDNRIHQAVILSAAIQQVEATTDLKLSDIELAEDLFNFKDLYEGYNS